MVAYKQIELHLNCLVYGNVWDDRKREFHLQGINRAIHQTLIFMVKPFSKLTFLERASLRNRVRVIGWITIFVTLSL
jgi:membrane-anchored protein YejM (alkaline phosphatase superfamily)